MSDVILDAHTLTWFLEGNAKLSEEAKRAIAAAQVLHVPIVALAEACWISLKGRSAVKVEELRAIVDADPRVRVGVLHSAIVFSASSIDHFNDMHDSLIVANAQAIVAADPSAVLLTSDATIRACGLVPTVW